METKEREEGLNPTEQRSPSLAGSAVGMISTQSFPAIVGTADMMLKSAGVTLIGFEKIGSGYCTAIVRGNISEVQLAMEVGVKTAERFGQFISSTIISRPMPDLEAVLPISSRMANLVDERGYSNLSNQAVGLLETRGFPAMVGAADAMLKSAEVQLMSYETTGEGLCTAIIRGHVSDVAMAIDAGIHEAERIGELHAVMVIPRAMDDLEQALPIASCWLEQPVPLQIPLELKEAQKELVIPDALEAAQAERLELPELSELSQADPPTQKELVIPEPTEITPAKPLELPELSESPQSERPAKEISE